MKNRYALLLFGVAAGTLAISYQFAHQEGYLGAKTPGVVLQVKSGFGHSTTLRSESGPIAISARACQPTSLELRWKRGEDTWQMWSKGPWGQLSRIRVDRRRTTTIELGPPLLVKPEVAIYGRQVNVNLGIFGRSGEKYTNLICRNDRRIQAPEIKIVNEVGTVLVADQFQYG
jgi:hypothetical protein